MKTPSKNMFLNFTALISVMCAMMCIAHSVWANVTVSANHQIKADWAITKQPRATGHSYVSAQVTADNRAMQLTDYVSIYLCSFDGCQLGLLRPVRMDRIMDFFERLVIPKWAFEGSPEFGPQPLTGTEYNGHVYNPGLLGSYAVAQHSIRTELDAQNRGSARLGAIAQGRQAPGGRIFVTAHASDPLIWEGPALIYTMNVRILERNFRVEGSEIRSEDGITTTHVGVADSEMGVFFSCTDGRLIEFSTPSNPLIGTADGRLHERSYQDPEDQPSFVIVREGGEPFEIPEGVACSLAINVATRAHTIVEESPGLPGPLEPFGW